MATITDEDVKRIIKEGSETQGDLIEHWKREGLSDREIAELLYYEM